MDIQSQNLSTPIDAAGSRIEYTDMTFINEGGRQIGTAPAAATLKGNSDYLWANNELLLTSAAAAA